MSVSVDSCWCFVIVSVRQSHLCYWLLSPFAFTVFHSYQVHSRGGQSAQKWGWQTIRSSQSWQSPQASLFKPSCQCMHHFPLITLCTVMSSVACDEKIDAFIFTNGSPVITAAEAHSNIRTRETQWKPHERRAWYAKVQEMRFLPESSFHTVRTPYFK